MTKQNSINKKAQDFTIDPGASGDSVLQFDINGTSEFRIGIDDDAGDSFKLSQGSALGTNDTFIMTTSGERTMPLQPAFLVYLGTDADDVTGDGTNYGKVKFDTEVFDHGGDYNTGTGAFTAPASGTYLLSVDIAFHDIDANHWRAYVSLATSNGTYYAGEYNAGNVRSPTGTLMQSLVFNADMDAADSGGVYFYVSGGTKTIDITAGTLGLRKTVFGGVLLC